MRIIEIMYNKTLLPTKGKNSVKKKKSEVSIVIIANYHPRAPKEINIREPHFIFKNTQALPCSSRSFLIRRVKQ